MLLFLAPAALEAWSPLASVAATLVMGAGAAIALYAGIHAIGSIQYDREHYERLKEAAHDHVRRLSRFPECNPNPVLELNADGLPVYANPAARRLALLVAGGEDDLAVLIPKTQEVAASDTSVPSGQLLRTQASLRWQRAGP